MVRKSRFDWGGDKGYCNEAEEVDLDLGLLSGMGAHPVPGSPGLL